MTYTLYEINKKLSKCFNLPKVEEFLNKKPLSTNINIERKFLYFLGEPPKVIYEYDYFIPARYKLNDYLNIKDKKLNYKLILDEKLEKEYLNLY